jgi:hypothetical protein
VNPRRVREIVREGNGESSVVLRNGVRVRVGRNYASQVGALLENRVAAETREYSS